jgi:hypothetical protein
MTLKLERKYTSDDMWLVFFLGVAVGVATAVVLVLLDLKPTGACL